MNACAGDALAGTAAVTGVPPQYCSALALEQALGDPAHGANTLSARAAMALDEEGGFPEAAVSLLQRLGLPNVYVPRPLGGDFDCSESAIALGRAIARRDMSAAVSSSTMIWSTLAWIGGNAEQQQAVAEWVVAQGSFPCLAYSEAEHGADLVSNTVSARRSADGTAYVLNGEKWPINRATRSGFIVLLARTDDSHSMRNHSLFIVNKAQLSSRCYHHLPRVHTHGLRGCDISGIGFRDCVVPATARIGAEGHGLELALKGFQVSRTHCTALSLGVGDSGLRLVADFAAERRLYGTTVDRLPHARDVLANAYLSQLMAECVAITAARGLHWHPSQFSSWSSIAKVQVSSLVDQAMQQVAAVLGARHYLREQHGEGMFQKFLRDGAIVSVFDGSSAVCLDSLATQLPLLVRGRRRSKASWEEAQALYDLQRPVPPFRFDRLDLSGHGRDAVLESLPGLTDVLGDLRPDALCTADTLQALRRAAAGIAAQLAALDTAVLGEATLGQRPGQRPGQHNTARQFGFAQRYGELHTAVCALGLWIHNRHGLGDFFAAGQWLQAVLERAGASVFQCGQLAPELADALHAQLDHQRRQRQMFSLLSWPLAQAGSRESLHPLFGVPTA